MITELIDSQSENDSKDGWEMTRRFRMLFDDWYNGEGDYVLENQEGPTDFFIIPRVGDPFFDRLELVVTNRNFVPDTRHNSYGYLTLTYSTEGSIVREEVPDQINSWREALTISTQTVSVDGYINSAGVRKDWPTVWLASTPGGTPTITPTDDNRPDLIKTVPVIGYRLTAYGEGFLAKRILDSIGKINSDIFLKRIFEDKTGAIPPAAPTPVADVEAYDDTERWHFSGCDVTLVKQGTYQYDFTFEYNGGGWNNFLGTSIPPVANNGVVTDLYQTVSVRSLLDGLDNIDDDFWSNGSGSDRT